MATTSEESKLHNRIFLRYRYHASHVTQSIAFVSFSLSPMNMSLVSVQSKFISLSSTIMSSVPIKYISFLVPYYYTHNKVKSKK